MALTEFQRDILRFLAPRRSRDIDLFHDTIEAVAKTVAADRVLMEGAGYTMRFVREAPTFAEAVVERDGQATLMQWVFDSAFRFFPLVTDETLGLALHPFDLATNKVLAMAGRLEVRDFIDLLMCCEHIQPLGYLVWAACGKDPGFGPPALIQEIRRGGRYSQAEIDLLDFEGVAPTAGDIGRRWHRQLDEAELVCEVLPFAEVGTAVVMADGTLCQLDAHALGDTIERASVRFHKGSIGGAWPGFPATG